MSSCATRASRAACCDCPLVSKTRRISSRISIRRWDRTRLRRRRSTDQRSTTNDCEGFPVTWTRILVALAVLSLSVPAGAQYFGRNKVQYGRFDFSILQTPHFDVYYYDSEREAAQLAARLAERWYDRFSVELDYKFKRRQPIILYASHSHFAQTSIIP